MAALLRLVVVLAGVIILLNRKWSLGLVLLIATLAISLLFGYPLSSAGFDALAASVDLLTLSLAVVVVLVMVLGDLMRRSTALEYMVDGLQALVPNACIVLAALPALIGLLPMIGGAMLSAPMVDGVGDRLGIDGGRKTFVNYWFRHIWEPISPINPSMVLAAGLLGLTIPQLMGAAWPVTLSAVAGGILFGLLGIRRCSDGNPAPASWTQGLCKLATSIWPIALAIVLSLVLKVDDRFNLAIGLVVAVALVMLVNRIPARTLVVIFRGHIPWRTVLVIFGALIFRRVLENSGAVQAVSEDLTGLHVTPAVIAFVVPFVASLLTGVMVAAYSIGFPVVLPLVVAADGTLTSAWANWLMIAGFMGCMCSPVHLCLALTRVYFKAEWGQVYRPIAAATLLVVVIGAIILALA